MAEVVVGGAVSLLAEAFLSSVLEKLFEKMASREVVDFIRGRKVAVALPQRGIKRSMKKVVHSFHGPVEIDLKFNKQIHLRLYGKDFHRSDLFLLLRSPLRSLPFPSKFQSSQVLHKEENMAEALVGGAFLSAFLQVLFDRMASREVVDFIRGRKVTDELLKQLKTMLLPLNAVLYDAEKKEVENPAVKEWLDMLKDAVYIADDLLDEIATEASRCKLEAEFQTTSTRSKVRNFISATSLNHFGKGIEPKIKEVLHTLKCLAEQISVIGLTPTKDVGGKASQRLPTTSLVEESGICGRDADKEALVNLLLSNDVSGNEVSVIAIVGMGGIGKTTLAQLVYNNNRVKKHFDLKAWICVSNKFDVFEVTTTILEAVTSSTCDIKDPNRLQLTLQENLKGKKFLLVLDDVWGLNYNDWEILQRPFNCGASTSKIIVTTRSESVASVMRVFSTHPLNQLSNEDCWSLFAKHAFENGNSNAHPQLEEIGKLIVEKCGGLPLVAKALGGLLRNKLDVEEWNKILKSEIWSLPNDRCDILPALRLSYFYLPSHLKRCFAYCSIFPKDCSFQKEKVVQLWMAEGFLGQPDESMGIEEIGDVYFLDLVARSLFQRSSRHPSCFEMHDLVNDLAQFVSGEFCLRLDGDYMDTNVKMTRHFAYFRAEYNPSKKFEALYEAKHLRTFLPLGWSLEEWCCLSKTVAHDLVPTLRCLHVLSFSGFGDVTELPDSIGNLKHLRYLDLSFTRIKRLPESTCKLCNLQTLNLSCCFNLVVLPTNMRKLTNLRHLDFTKTRIEEMPIQMGRLKCLQTLTKFVVGKDCGFQIGELGHLPNLRGALMIGKLDNVVNVTEALDAKLQAKKYLEELELEYAGGGNAHNSQSESDVLSNLQPHTNLKKLVINYYTGTSLPSWVGDRSFSNITLLHLKNCRYCCSLPTLAHLPCLKELFIVRFHEVVTVGPEFYDSGSSTKIPFETLEILRFEAMLKWEEWFCFEGAFPHLEQLYLENCPKLREVLPNHLPCLTKLVISDCSQLVASLPRTSAISDLQLTHCDKLLMDLPPNLRKLTVKGFEKLESLPEIVHNHFLEEFEISYCSSFKLLPRGGLPINLKKLKINNCDSLRSFALDFFPNLFEIEIKGRNMESFSVQEGCHNDLKSLIITNCPKFVAFPSGGLSAPNLVRISFINCENLQSLPEKMATLLPSLTYLGTKNCPEVESFPEEGLPSNLDCVFINNCDKLFANRMGWNLQRLSSLRELTIEGNNSDVESFPDEGLLPTTLAALVIRGFPNLKSLNKKGLQHLTSFKYLWICYNPKFKYMSEDGLPTTITHLWINECPLLEKRCQRKKGKEWRKIAHIRYIIINNDLIT